MWGVGLVLVGFGLAVKSAPSSSASSVSSRQNDDLIRREQLINRVTQPYNRTVSMCDYLAQFSYLVPQEQLPSKCARLRAVGPEAVARMKAMKDLDLLSRQVDQFEITIATPLRDMEAAYATVQRLMK
jgi:hypothetical protein